jgi:hypothetical protein
MGLKWGVPEFWRLCLVLSSGERQGAWIAGTLWVGCGLRNLIDQPFGATVRARIWPRGSQRDDLHGDGQMAEPTESLGGLGNCRPDPVNGGETAGRNPRRNRGHDGSISPKLGSWTAHGLRQLRGANRVPGAADQDPTCVRKGSYHERLPQPGFWQGGERGGQAAAAARSPRLIRFANPRMRWWS